MPIRLASAADAPAFGKLLYAFNVEFGEETPAAELIARRAAPLIESGELTVLLPQRFGLRYSERDAPVLATDGFRLRVGPLRCGEVR